MNLSSADWTCLAEKIKEIFVWGIETNEMTPEEYLAGMGKEYRNIPNLRVYGQPRWWSGDPYTVMVQSVFVQNTAWGSVQKVTVAMETQLTPAAVSGMELGTLEELIRLRKTTHNFDDSFVEICRSYQAFSIYPLEDECDEECLSDRNGRIIDLRKQIYELFDT